MANDIKHELLATFTGRSFCVVHLVVQFVRRKNYLQKGLFLSFYSTVFGTILATPPAREESTPSLAQRIEENGAVEGAVTYATAGSTEGERTEGLFRFFASRLCVDLRCIQ